jgi:FkbM family methyltransferase
MLKNLPRIVRRFRSTMREQAERFVRWMAAYHLSRRCLNCVHLMLSPSSKQWFHAHFFRLFLDSRRTLIQGGDWAIRFAGKPIRLPITPILSVNEWGLALAILGHEADIKVTYETFVTTRRPQVFFDIGANYGTHSLLFLSHGIRTVTFEPNTQCHNYLRRTCALNGFSCDIRPLALGAHEGYIDFWFPESATWLGTTEPEVRDRQSREGRSLTNIRVQQTTVDRFVANSGLKPELIKIDTEGSELGVLRGARETLTSCRPAVIFESFVDSRDRSELWSLFVEMNYSIFPLPVLPHCCLSAVIEKPRFLTSRRSNFIALSNT